MLKLIKRSKIRISPISNWNWNRKINKNPTCGSTCCEQRRDSILRNGHFSSSSGDEEEADQSTTTRTIGSNCDNRVLLLTLKVVIRVKELCGSQGVYSIDLKLALNMALNMRPMVELCFGQLNQYQPIHACSTSVRGRSVGFLVPFFVPFSARYSSQSNWPPEHFIRCKCQSCAQTPCYHELLTMVLWLDGKGGTGHCIEGFFGHPIAKVGCSTHSMLYKGHHEILNRHVPQFLPHVFCRFSLG